MDSAIVTRRPIGVRSTSALWRSGGMSRHWGCRRRSRVDRVHADRRELDHEGADEAGHAAVDRRHGRRAWIGTVAGEASVDEDRGVLSEPWPQRVDHLRVPDELSVTSLTRPIDLVLRRCSSRARSRRGRGGRPRRRLECVRDRVRLREVEADAARAAADLPGRRFGAGLIAAGHDDLAALVGIGLRQFSAETLRPPTTTTLPFAIRLLLSWREREEPCPRGRGPGSLRPLGRCRRTGRPLGEEPALAEDVVPRLVELPEVLSGRRRRADRCA